MMDPSQMSENSVPATSTNNLGFTPSNLPNQNHAIHLVPYETKTIPFLEWAPSYNSLILVSIDFL